MGMSLLEVEHPAKVTMFGTSTYTIAAGKNLKIETSPSGITILDELVPEGKSWSVSININIEETDA